MPPHTMEDVEGYFGGWGVVAVRGRVDGNLGLGTSCFNALG